jgi:hypothetical protein
MSFLVIYNTRSPEHQQIAVSDTEAQKCIDAQQRLVKALDIEIMYDQIAEAHWNYKNKVNYWNLRTISTPHTDYILNHEIRSSLNSLAFNIFNLGKLYLDWHYHEKDSRCFAYELTGHEETKIAVRSQHNEIYESNLHYFIGYKLRNRNQHSALPVKTFTTGMHHNHFTQNRTASFNIFYDYKALRKAKIPETKINQNTKFDLTDIIDGYVFAISQKHMLNRKLTESVISEARFIFLDMWQSLIDQTGYSNYHCELHSDNKNQDPLIISLEWFKVYDYLKSKHGNSIDHRTISFQSQAHSI